MFTTKNETSNACPTSAVRATATTIDSSPSSTGTRPATTAPNTSRSTISAAGSPISSSPFCRSSSESFSKSASAVSEPVIETWKPSCPFSAVDQLDQRSDLVASHHERHHRRVAILRDERLVVRAVVAPRVGDDAERLAAVGERLHLRPELGLVDREAIRAHDDDLARGRLGREARADQRSRLLRLGVARDVPVARQRAPEQHRDHDERNEHDRAPHSDGPLRMNGTRARKTLSREDIWGSSFLLVRGLAVAGVGDPGDEHVVRMVDEVVSREGVDELAIAAVVRGRDGHELAVARGRREPFGPDEEAVSVAARTMPPRRGSADRRLSATPRRSP